LPELLLLDEPASNVDESGAKLIEQVLCQLRSEQGVTILMVGHDMATIKRIADHVTQINCQVTFDGLPGGLDAVENTFSLSGVANLANETVRNMPRKG
jgi:ABC-type Mn2+/Zn2+ transport system ATPase subunit